MHLHLFFSEHHPHQDRKNSSVTQQQTRPQLSAVLVDVLCCPWLRQLSLSTIHPALLLVLLHLRSLTAELSLPSPVLWRFDTSTNFRESASIPHTFHLPSPPLSSPLLPSPPLSSPLLQSRASSGPFSQRSPRKSANPFNLALQDKRYGGASEAAAQMAQPNAEPEDDYE